MRCILKNYFITSFFVLGNANQIIFNNVLNLLYTDEVCVSETVYTYQLNLFVTRSIKYRYKFYKLEKLMNQRRNFLCEFKTESYSLRVLSIYVSIKEYIYIY